ncbi:alpha/beta-hydrolase [Dendrothele bispora CBS 962.96]|uniref:Dipeptidyl-peptidase V n=1 Tax=Dendrothele bispora (strain CBS 962.96) TaxID=1314807 RepID=A0A4S8MNP7_DENBC|nr:alpha/beta-hydrolase [Dendrothele bispora CBS 962.96]
MRFPLTLLGLSAQVPLQSTPSISPRPTMALQHAFRFKEGSDVFSPKDLVELGRPGAGVANHAGDLVLIPFSKYSFEKKQNKKSVYVAPLGTTTEPVELSTAAGGEAFWLTGRTVAHVVEGENKTLDLYTIDVKFHTSDEGTANVLSTGSPKKIGSFPTNGATNFRYSSGGFLVFSDAVYSDGQLETVKEQDEAWENRGTTAFVYDRTYERHWDTWVGPKTNTLFSVRLWQDPDHEWHFGNKYTNLLKDTGHSSPVEPFGGTDDFDVSKNQVIYTTLDPDHADVAAWHTRQNVYVVDIAGGSRPRQLTSGAQGATHGPVFNENGSKAAWLELDEDGYESDRAKIVIYDLQKDVRYTLTQKWDRSPDGLAFSKEGDFIYFTAGDIGKIKVYVLPLPPTPAKSTTDPDLPPKYYTPVAISEDGAASSLQTLFFGKLVFSKSSFTSPNDVFFVIGLKSLENEITQSDDLVKFSGSVQQVTHLTEAGLKGKHLSKGEEFWFKGANDLDVHGYALKPREWEEGQKKKYPVVLLIHGGPQGAWEDQWSTRWNPNGNKLIDVKPAFFAHSPSVFTQQGYFTLMINPTGSTTYGQNLTDAITGDWGGKPFVDMQKGWKFALDKYPEIDPDRAVAAGASWGGYAINWIQGHPEFGFGFKALVCHDGVFDTTYNGFSTDELFFFNHDWTGRPWDKPSQELSQKFNPSNYVSKWGTPQLLIHGSKDYRLPETEGIGAFHALQQLGVPSRLVIFPDENHWVLNHGNSLKWHYEVFRWFDQFVGSGSQ